MRVIKINKKGLKVVAFNNWFITYGRINGRYQIEAKILYDFCIHIYKSEKKPIIRNIHLIAALLLIPKLILITLAFIIYGISTYIDGARNFIANGAWVTNVREFNIVNIILLIISIILLIIKW